ncbi:DNA repair protein RecO [Patescibacteria group bacterium]
MFAMIKTPAFIIKKHNFREFDRIYTVYTEELGKISLLVRSARKIKSKLSSGLENFDEVKLNFIKGRIFNHLAGLSIVRRNSDILKDCERINFTYDCLELIDKFIKPDEKDEQVFNLMREVIGGINSSSSIDFQKIQVYFFWKFVDLLGYRPELYRCALCDNMSREDKGGGVWFNITEHIIICRKCAGAGILIKKNTLENLRKIFQINLNEFFKLDLDKQLVEITDRAKQIKLSEL